MLKPSLKFYLLITLLSTLFVFFVALAFDNPTSSPPTGGGYLQTQSGQLLITKPTKVTSGNNFIVENGNVGIGTTAPQAKLDVVGIIKGQYGRGITAGGAGVTKYFKVGSLPYTSLSTFEKLYVQVWGGGNSSWEWQLSGIDEYVISSREGKVIYRQRKLGETGNYQLLVYNTGSGYDFFIAVVNQNYPNILIRSFRLQSEGAWVEQQIVETTPSGTDDTSNWTVYTTITTDKYGNVGIGTTTPAQKLHVEGNTYISGNVGIGTTTPEAKLHVVGKTIFQADGPILHGKNAAGTYTFAINNDGSNLNFYGYDTGWFNYMTVNNAGTKAVSFNAGNVGIGTTTPAQKLHVEGNTYISGNVGIGTTVPQYKLDVVDFIRIKPSAANIGDFGLRVDALPGTNPKLLFSDNPASIETLNWDLTISTNVDGTTNDGAIYLRPRAAASTGAGGVFIINDSNVLANNQPIFRITDLTSHRLVVTRAGNVGIGTTTPGYKLDVVGNIRTTGCLVYNGGTLGTCVSEEQLKNVIGSFQIDNALSKIIQLKPVKYTFKFDPAQQVLIGLLAEETEKIAPELIEIKDGQKQIKYGELQWMQIEAIKELNNKIKEQQKEIDELKAQLTSLK